MDITWRLVAITTIVIVAILFIKTKLELEKLKETVRLNKESNEKDIRIANKEISLLDFKIENTNKSVESCDARIDNAALTIKSITQRIDDNEKELNQKYVDLVQLIEKNKTDFDNEIATLAKSILDIKDINEKLKNQLAIFTEIDADSKQLNSDDTYIENENLIPEHNNTGDTDSKTELDVEQEVAFDWMNNSNANLFITGKAGTGKSFLLKHFVKKTRKSVLVLAPTGIAALNANGVTIHSAFGWDNLQLNIDDIINKNLKLKSEKRQVLKNVCTIIIDEISMVRADIFEKIDRILKIMQSNSKMFLRGNGIPVM